MASGGQYVGGVVGYDESGFPEWAASSDGNNGYWKPGATGGGQLPELWRQ